MSVRAILVGYPAGDVVLTSASATVEPGIKGYIWQPCSTDTVAGTAWNSVIRHEGE